MSESDVPATTQRMTTRARNAHAHPGLPDAPEVRAPKGGVTKKQLAERKKEEKRQKTQHAIRRIGEVEKRMADNEMVDVTPGPRASNRYQTGPLPRTSYTQLLLKKTQKPWTLMILKVPTSLGTQSPSIPRLPRTKYQKRTLSQGK